MMCITVEAIRETDFRHELRRLMRQVQENRDDMGKANVFPVDDAADDRFVNAVLQGRIVFSLSAC